MLLSTTVAVLLMTCSAEIILHDSDGSVLSDQPQHDPYMLSDADPYSNDGWMADWNPDWALLGGRINQPKCVDIPSNMSLCRHIGYTQMRLPNLLEHDTLQEVTSQAKSWNPLIGIRCHPDTKLFLCSLFSPVCLDRPIWPCRSLCDAVKNSCQGFMSKYGYPWPEMLRCDKFPLDNDLCIGLQNDNKPDDRVCEPCNKPDTFEGIIDNYCSSDFVLRVSVAETVISEGYIKVITNDKKRAYKKGPLKKRDLKDMSLYIEDGENCECPTIDEVTGNDREQILLMGRIVNGRRMVTYVQKYDKKSQALRNARRSMRDDSICSNGVHRLTDEEEEETQQEVETNVMPAQPEVPRRNRDREDRNRRKDGNRRKGRKGDRDRNRNRDRDSDRRRDRKRRPSRDRDSDRDGERRSRRREREDTTTNAN